MQISFSLDRVTFSLAVAKSRITVEHHFLTTVTQEKFCAHLGTTTWRNHKSFIRLSPPLTGPLCMSHVLLSRFSPPLVYPPSLNLIQFFYILRSTINKPRPPLRNSAKHRTWVSFNYNTVSQSTKSEALFLFLSFCV